MVADNRHTLLYVRSDSGRNTCVFFLYIICHMHIIIIFSSNNLIVLVVFNTDSLDKSKLLDLRNIQRCTFFYFLD
jgi:hypothetical protein